MFCFIDYMRLIVFGVFLFCTSLSAQMGGSNTYQFLEFFPSPRHMSLGTWVSTLSTAQSTVAWQIQPWYQTLYEGQIVFNYQPYFAGINRGTAAAVFTLNESHTILIDTRFIHYGTFDERDIFGEKIGEFSGNEVALGVAYSYAIDSKNLRVGARLNLD